MNRYYWTRIRTGSYQGQFRICDRLLDTWIAHCQFKEAAELIVGALNYQRPATIQPSPIKQVQLHDTAKLSLGPDFLPNNPFCFHAAGR